jgi:hypothetical protein
MVPSHAPATEAGAATATGDFSGWGSIAFDRVDGMRVLRGGSSEPVRGGSREHPHAPAEPGCIVGDNHGETVVASGQVVVEDHRSQVRCTDVGGV